MGKGAAEVIGRLAGVQHGVVARWQLLRLGLGRGLVDSSIARGALLPLPGYRGVYAVGHRALTRNSYLIAATLAHRAVLSHASAAELWGLRGRSRGIELTRRTKGRTVEGIVVHRSGRLDDADRVMRSRIPVTSVPRTLADMANRLNTKQLERAVTAAERQQLLDWSAMDDFLRRTPYGTGRLQEVLGRADPRAVELFEGLEELFLDLWRGAPRPEPEPQALVAGYRVDFLWPLARVIVECDSRKFHSGRLKVDEDWLRDARLRAAGYDVHRASHRILTQMPGTFIETVHRAILDRSTLLAAA